MRKIVIVLLIFLTISISAGVAYCISANGQPQEHTCTSAIDDVELEHNDVTFMGEIVPLHNFDVYENLDREIQVNRLWHSQTILLLKRANRYFPIIEPILREHGVHDDLKYIAVIESSLTNVVSPAGARGFWQFLSATAKEYGLEVNNDVDERYHIEKATVAAIKYFTKMKNRFGSWTMAAASYNVGMGNLAKYVNIQQCNNYYDLVLGEETERYIFRAIAIKQIFEDPEKFGFYISNDRLYPPIPYTIVDVDTTILNIADFAFKQGTNYKMLKLLNPWLRSNTLPNPKRKTYQIKIIDPKFREVVIDTITQTQPSDIEIE